MGEPREETPLFIREALAAAIEPLSAYPVAEGLPELRSAIAAWVGRRFGAPLDPDTEIVPTLGSKEAIFHLAQVVDGDLVAMGTPSYPVYERGAAFAGKALLELPLRAGAGFLPDLDAVPAAVARRARLMFLNYPNNPTGGVVDDGFFARAVEFARANDVVVVHDNAYSEITYDGYRAPSFLETPGALDVGIEIFSLSKTYNMTGWRAGAVVGNRELVGAYWQLKTNIDSGMFEALQEASAAALRSDQSSVAEMCAIYQRRRDVLVGALQRIGLRVDPPKGAIYVWARVPEGETSASFTERVLEEAAVVISPGAAYGPSGEGFVRMSLTVPDDRLNEAAERISSLVEP
jgi:LL-diaminopimelate aminotransferase